MEKEKGGIFWTRGRTQDKQRWIKEGWAAQPFYTEKQNNNYNSRNGKRSAWKEPCFLPQFLGSPMHIAHFSTARNAIVPWQCNAVHHHSASRCLPSWWRSAVPGTVLSLLLSAAFNPLLPSQTLTASEAIDISFNIQRANSTSIQLLHGFSCCTVLASSQYKHRYIKWKTSRSLYCFAILISAFNQGESPS